MYLEQRLAEQPCARSAIIGPVPRGTQRSGRTRLIGYWRDGSSPGWPDPQVFVDGGWSPQEREAVAGYLRVGRGWRHYMGQSLCRICGQPNGSSELTDGDWVWPEGLAHYVATHSVRLPEEFVVHVLSERKPNVRRLPRGAPDMSWWKAQVPQP